MTEILNELKSPKVIKKLKKVPITSDILTFVRHCTPGDVVLSRKYTADNLRKTITDYIISSAQWTPYVSSKLVSFNSEFVGYLDDMVIASRDIYDHMLYNQRTLLLRCNLLTKNQIKKNN